jgi:RHS repeat-associated protein
VLQPGTATRGAGRCHNGDGLRVAKTVDGTTTRITWDVLGLPRVLADGDEYVWGQGLIGRVTAGGTATYAHADGLGSIRLLTDAMGTSVGTKQYDAFGAARTTTGVMLPFGYTGEQEDSESGLVYLRARYLDPGTGRFLSQDRFAGFIAVPGTQHRYTYVGNSPTRWADPTGRVAEFVTGGGGGGYVGAVLVLTGAAAAYYGASAAQQAAEAIAQASASSGSSGSGGPAPGDRSYPDRESALQGALEASGINPGNAAPVPGEDLNPGSRGPYGHDFEDGTREGPHFHDAAGQHHFYPPDQPCITP